MFCQVSHDATPKGDSNKPSEKKDTMAGRPDSEIHFELGGERDREVLVGSKAETEDKRQTTGECDTEPCRTAAQLQSDHPGAAGSEAEGTVRNESPCGECWLLSSNEMEPSVAQTVASSTLSGNQGYILLCDDVSMAQTGGNRHPSSVSGKNSSDTGRSEEDKENHNEHDLPSTEIKTTSSKMSDSPTIVNIQTEDVCLKNTANSSDFPTQRIEEFVGSLDPGQRSNDECSVSVMFSGSVTQESCSKFVCEILKYLLYQRQQLPMPYDQLQFFQKKQQTMGRADELVARKPLKTEGWDGKKCQRVLKEMEEVLLHLEELFSLSLVPRVLLLLGGNIMLPKELYEVNLEGIALGSLEQSLKTATCLRSLFRTLFMADILSDSKPVQLMTTTVMVQGHRDCGVGWFRPKMDYQVPTRVKKQIIVLSCGSEEEVCHLSQAARTNWDDYIWFQAPVTIKGFYK
ncbi:MAD2L1-binding protein [Polyodon spathula]|nr:MAD2L1-binding protein [Polyodon spathula]